MREHVKNRALLLFLLLIPYVSNAQNYIQVGPAVYPLGAWGMELVGDIRIVNITPGLSLGGGVMGIINKMITHDEPTPGKSVRGVYVAPQVNLRYSFTRVFDCYFRGGVGWIGSKKETENNRGKIMFNGMLGVGLSIGPHLGFYTEIGLPFSSIGVRLAL